MKNFPISCEVAYVRVWQQAGGNNTTTDPVSNCTFREPCIDSQNPCLVNATFNSNCKCVGNEIDADNDGVCSVLDPNDNDECTPNACSGGTNSGCTIIDSEDFESGFGIWNSGGEDSSRFGSIDFANSGKRGIRIRDNSGSLSSAFTNALDLSTYNTIDVSFSYLTKSMEPDEAFLLEVSGNDGNSYTTVKRWRSGIEFSNDIRVAATETINVNLTRNTRIRFRCEASANGDRVYIDDVVIQNCENSPKLNSSNFGNQNISLYPNPTSNQINIDISEALDIDNMDAIDVSIYNTNGKVLYNEQLPIKEILNINIDQLQNNVQYLVILKSEDEKVLSTKFLKMK